MVNKKFLVGGLIVVILVFTVVLMIGNRGTDRAQIGPAIPDGAGQNGSLIKDGPAIPDGGNEIKNEIKKEEVQEKIIISLPYAPSQPTSSIVPMGETIFHPKPQNPEGHPGIDFQWNLGKPIDIIACIDGEIISAMKTPSHNKWDVTVKTGNYAIAYHELENIDSKIIQGAKIVLGQRIGEPGKFDGNHYNMHWELRLGTNRICPLNYFTPDAKARIEKSWANTNWPELKRNAPDICSGDYKGKEK